LPVPPENPDRRIALFIDFENLVTNTGITPASFDLQPSLDRLLEKGKVIFRRAYCDWTRFREAKAHLHELGVELIDVPPSTRAGKNAADMRLTIDALELCYAREHIDTYVIASGDSDFCPLASKLRENDRRVIGLAVKEATSGMFVKACDEFIYLKPEQRRGERPARPPRRGTPPSPSTPSSEKSSNPRPDGKRREVPEIAREVLEALLARATGPLNPSLIKETIVRKEPDFDERDHGFSSFSRMLEALEAEGLCTRLLQGRQWYIVPKESASGPANKSAPQAGATVEPLEPEEEEQVEEEAIPDPD
jgi:uncharacterized LabA/DUF88 family protein